MGRPHVVEAESGNKQRIVQTWAAIRAARKIIQDWCKSCNHDGIGSQGANLCLGLHEAFKINESVSQEEHGANKEEPVTTHKNAAAAKRNLPCHE